MQELKRLMRRLTPLELAARELVEAELALLEAQSGVDYAESLVAYNTKRVERLRSYITAGDAPKNFPILPRGGFSDEARPIREEA